MSDYINFGAFDFMSEHQPTAPSSGVDLEAMLADYPADFNTDSGLPDILAVGDGSTGTDYVDEPNVGSVNRDSSNNFGHLDFNAMDYSYRNGIIPRPMPLTSASAVGFAQTTIDPQQLVLSPFASSYVVPTSQASVHRSATNINNPGTLSNFPFHQNRQQYEANCGAASNTAQPVGPAPSVSLHHPQPHWQSASPAGEVNWLDSTTRLEQ